MANEWRPGTTVAWTESDGPGRVPPAPSRRTGAAAAAALAVAIVGMLTSSSVCPDHALWINVVGSLTLIVGVTAIVATVKASPASVVLSLLSATGGVMIAGIDVVHGVTSGRVSLLAFAGAAFASAASAITMLRLRVWERSVLTEALNSEDPAAAQAVAGPAEAGTTSPLPVATTASAEASEGYETISR